MHIDTADQIPVSRKSTLFAMPLPVFRLVLMSTSGTLARCSSFGASEAQDMGLLAFVGEVVDITAIFPAGHALVVISPVVAGTNAMRITNEERTDPVVNTEVDDLSCRFMAQVTDASGQTSALLVLGTLQFLPASRVLLAAGLFLGNLAQVLVALSLERSNTAPRDNQRLPGIRRHCRQVNFSEIDGGMYIAGCVLLLLDLDTHMQFKPAIPDEGNRPALLWKSNGQNQSCTPSPHGKHNPPVFFRDRLRRPRDRVVSFCFVGVAHLHMRMGLPQVFGGLDVGKKGVDNHLNRLTVQGKTGFGRCLQCVSSRPTATLQARRFVQFHTAIPHLGRFHLSITQASKLGRRQDLQSVDFDGVHVYHRTMNTDSLQMGKTRSTHSLRASHCGWIPKYHRQPLTGEVQKATKRLVPSPRSETGLPALFR